MQKISSALSKVMLREGLWMFRVLCQVRVELLKHEVRKVAILDRARFVLACFKAVMYERGDVWMV